MNKFNRTHTMLCLVFGAAAIVAMAEIDHGPLEVKITSKPEYVNLAQYFFVTLTVKLPHAHLEAGLPVTHPIFDGFRIVGTHDRREALPDGGIRLQRAFRLQPQPGAPRFRMAPLAIEWRDNTPAAVPPNGYQFVPAVRFERQPLHLAEPAGIDGLQPLPFSYDRSPWPITAIASGLLILVAVTFWIQRHKRVPTASPSPREQAETELDELLKRHLPDEARWSDFYAELTLILRRFIERSHRIPATKKTTREFLHAIRNDSRFNPAWVASVTTLLKYAEAMKYAGHQPDIESVDHTVHTARECIETAKPESADDVATD